MTNVRPSRSASIVRESTGFLDVGPGVEVRSWATDGGRVVVAVEYRGLLVAGSLVVEVGMGCVVTERGANPVVEVTAVRYVAEDTSDPPVVEDACVVTVFEFMLDAAGTVPEPEPPTAQLVEPGATASSSRPMMLRVRARPSR